MCACTLIGRLADTAQIVEKADISDPEAFQSALDDAVAKYVATIDDLRLPGARACMTTSTGSRPRSSNTTSRTRWRAGAARRVRRGRVHTGNDDYGVVTDR